MMADHIKRWVLIAVCLVACVCQVRASGFMEVRNFPRESYKGGPQNWVAIQDSVGQLYVGNRDGLLSFDGERWRKQVLPNFSAVRSLLYDRDSDRIYAGGTEEFGYFSPDPFSGKLVYTSLIPSIDKEVPKFTEIWNILKTDGKLWFQGDNHIFCYDGKSTVVLPADGRVSASGVANGKLYLGFENGKLAVIDKGQLTYLDGLEILRGKKITAILPARTFLLIGTSVDGLYYYQDKNIRPFESDINNFLKENQLFCAASDGDDYVFGTVTCGAVVKNFKSGVTRYVNKTSGMQNNTVLHADFDKTGNIWLSLDNGLDYAVYNSPVSNLIGSSNDVGAGYASLRRGDRFYFGTNQGLYSAHYPFVSTPSPLALTREFQGQIWSITEFGGGFFVAGDAGVYVNENGGFRKIDGITGTYRAWEIPGKPGSAIASSYDGFHLLKKDNGIWKNVGVIAGSRDVRGDFRFDNFGNLWISHWLKGVYRLHYNYNDNMFDVNRLFTEKDGLPTTRNNSIAIFHGRPVITNAQGFYTYDYSSDRIVADKQLKELFNASDEGTIHSDNNTLLLVGKSGINVASPDSNGIYTSNLTIVKSLVDGLVNGYEQLSVINPEEVIIANQTGFWSVNPKSSYAERWNPKPFVSAVYANTDSVVYRSPLHSEQKDELQLPYNLNSLRFEFTCPDYRAPGGVLYSSRLENYDKVWSPFSPESTREYTHLSEGHYVMRVKTKNQHTGEVGETSFSFEILPPWYRSIYAWIAYILIFVGFALTLIYLLKRWKRKAEISLEIQKEEELENMRRHAEQEALQKDYEIATLKSEQLEVDIKHKSSELSNATMNLIRKNEILHDIASKIAKIQELSDLGNAVQKELGHIQTSIKQNISHDDDWNTFNRNFDIVYGDYTKRLRDTFPQLTPSDIRLACYIKMGLSSKEIAPLVNISFKSVEMARYRLRKKMDLSADTTLTDFLSNF